MTQFIPRLINIGFGNVVALDQVVVIISPNSSSAKRMKDEARKSERLVDATQGRRTRSVIVTASNHLILTSIQVETLAGRFQAEAERVGYPKEVFD